MQRRLFTELTKPNEIRGYSDDSKSNTYTMLPKLLRMMSKLPHLPIHLDQPKNASLPRCDYHATQDREVGNSILQ